MRTSRDQVTSDDSINLVIADINKRAPDASGIRVCREAERVTARAIRIFQYLLMFRIQGFVRCPSMATEIPMQNVGSLDRLIRIVAGLVLLAIALLPPLAGLPLVAGLGPWKWLIAGVGVVMLLTGLLRTCPAYRLFGLNTGR
ncbi:YgaP family membrane protein [Methylobrevis pamukkalensis]|uniref:YgaP family membrane protein n=1 Tax=Methylobrevis pamukkalensis TaxID=1439726 RepID=UPI003CC9F3C9